MIGEKIDQNLPITSNEYEIKIRSKKDMARLIPLVHKYIVIVVVVVEVTFQTFSSFCFSYHHSLVMFRS